MTLNTRAVVSPLLILSLLALGGCEEKKTEQWYMAHHDELIQDYADCLQTQTFSSERCIPVVNAAKRSKHEPDVAAGIKHVKMEYLQRKTQPENPTS
ncbi:EexN family lipoprotein [Citrobacter sp. JGM124]|uniref:EexN family lipoprotein n=1 Tax=Citrobacter sp. JGM124 TaxID=2799789 RepID=UPI001BA5892D|nr:EexN family lipoprotein [Citrobacter sp. JGM124]MBS0847040.1 EexN family lipoprotein [Citrobacter sp. JGM124]